MGHPRISHFKTQDLSRLCFPFGPGHLENVTKPGWYYPLWSAQFPLEIIQTGHHEVSRRPPGGWATPHNNSSFNKHRMQHYGSRKGNNCLYVERSERASQEDTASTLTLKRDMIWRGWEWGREVSLLHRVK